VGAPVWSCSVENKSVETKQQNAACSPVSCACKGLEVASTVGTSCSLRKSFSPASVPPSQRGCTAYCQQLVIRYNAEVVGDTWHCRWVVCISMSLLGKHNSVTVRCASVTAWYATESLLGFASPCHCLVVHHNVSG
jgi:hypothetical protein